MKILLHTCCGICATVAAERLLCEGYTVTCFFYNPNIHPVDEYQRRLKTVEIVANQLNLELVEGPYEREKLFEAIKGKEYEPEGGARCLICYEMRLKKTYEYLQKKMFDRFTTTLTASPHKNAQVINDIGRRICEVRFICTDFKKKDGFKRAMELAREWDLYHQDYCGCIYSLEEKYRR